MTNDQADLTGFGAAAHPMLLKSYLSGTEETTDTDFFVVMEFSGNGFTFEIREADKYNLKSDDINRLKIGMSNSADIRSRLDESIRPKSIKDLRKTLHYIKGLINDLRHRDNRIHVKAIGTAALRDASNSAEILQMICDEIGEQIQFEIVEGPKEAELAAYGLTLFYPEASGLIVDMGGGSTEFGIIEDGEFKGSKSLNMGTGSIGAADKPGKFVSETLKELPDRYKEIDTLFLSGGTFRNINKQICIENGWDIKSTPPHEISLSDYKIHIKKLLKISDKEWEDMPEALEKRRGFLPQALKVVKKLEKQFPNGTSVALTKTKTRDGLFRFMHDAFVAPELHPTASVNCELGALAQD